MDSEERLIVVAFLLDATRVGEHAMLDWFIGAARELSDAPKNSVSRMKISWLSLSMRRRSLYRSQSHCVAKESPSIPRLPNAVLVKLAGPELL
jgi:hypothetical protein